MKTYEEVKEAIKNLKEIPEETGWGRGGHSVKDFLTALWWTIEEADDTYTRISPYAFEKKGTTEVTIIDPLNGEVYTKTKEEYEELTKMGAMNRLARAERDWALDKMLAAEHGKDIGDWPGQERRNEFMKKLKEPK
ncbi:MAG: hypothetical protein UT61_C0011G0002 [Candidatus Woesebacteria bacterium GW2011_GWA1_39_8]|uniref:Uncharacterized protein n=1 Tax=Candidatus Woesebacteria bacterium GW2011_GWA1_39_8 TaxID=1618552 RepID=A0A0G0PPV3_9BACT|nr:MAG: hypothetical protein UT61_C0011G0002 [Candidatus Woesebacteria bacterium GW2011_GWA1_39_8]